MRYSRRERLDAFRPDGRRAAYINDRLARKLAYSIAEIARACRGAVAFDEGAVERTCAAIARTGAVSTAVYTRYFDLLGAARRQEVRELERLFDGLTSLRLDARPFHVVRWGDAGLDAEVAQTYLRFVNIEPGSRVVFVEVDAATFDQTCELVGRAFSVLASAAPEIESEVKTLVRELVLVSARPGDGLAFDGATSFFCWGALFLNADRHQSLVDMIDGLSHESAHAHLFGVSLGDALVQNPPDERHPSPLRAEPRPLDGIYHAAYVSARMHYAHSRLLGAGVLSAGDAAQAEEAREIGRRAFWDGLATLDAHARLTPLGARVLAGARAYMAGAR